MAQAPILHAAQTPRPAESTELGHCVLGLLGLGPRGHAAAALLKRAGAGVDWCWDVDGERVEPHRMPRQHDLRVPEQAQLLLAVDAKQVAETLQFVAARAAGAFDVLELDPGLDPETLAPPLLRARRAGGGLLRHYAICVGLRRGAGDGPCAVTLSAADEASLEAFARRLESARVDVHVERDLAAVECASWAGPLLAFASGVAAGAGCAESATLCFVERVADECALIFERVFAVEATRVRETACWRRALLAHSAEDSSDRLFGDRVGRGHRVADALASRGVDQVASHATLLALGRIASTHDALSDATNVNALFELVVGARSRDEVLAACFDVGGDRR